MADDQILRAQGFFQDKKRMAWINLERRLWFSYAVIRDRDDAWLKERLTEVIPESDFYLHSNHRLKLDGCYAILQELDLMHLNPVNRHWISDEFP
jgi:hypothetical protein